MRPLPTSSGAPAPSRTPDPAIFAALADATRLALVDRLLPVPHLSTTALAEGTGMSRQAVRKHLGALQAAGLVVARKEGRRRLWSLQPGPLRQIRDWADRTRSMWEARFDRLDDVFASDDAPTGDPDAA
jgi:DNA-binding transcriptional ArsR family regulator